MTTTQSQEDPSKTAAASVLERMLAQGADPKRFDDPGSCGTRGARGDCDGVVGRLGLGRNTPAGREAGFAALMEAVVATWAETMGTLADGHCARLGASCLVQPAPGNRVLVWSGDDGERWILHVLDQAEDQPTRIVVPRPLTVTAPRIALRADAVHIRAEDFLSSTRNRHAVEHVRTETVNTRVAQIGTDIRRASHATDEVDGTVLQRAGTWISNTVREARFHARAFLFD